MSNKITNKQLQFYPIFKSMSQDDIEIFVTKIKQNKYTKDATIIKEGDIGNSILFLIHGDISITQALTLRTNKYENSDNREKELIRINSENENFTFGELSLFSENKKRNASVISNTECIIGELSFTDIFQICDKNNSIGYQFMKNIGQLITNQLKLSNENVLKLTTAISLIVND